MLDRRRFIAAACCLACADPAKAVIGHDRFRCSTPDLPERAPASRGAAHRPSVQWQVLYRAVPDPGKVWRQSDGATPHSGVITLDVAFLNGTRALHDMVARIAPDWTQGRLGRRIVFRFGESPRHAPIRISFHGGSGNWSDIGRDALGKTRHDSPTMNLDEVTGRSIRHEFGHALGLHHEHQHPLAGIRWNKPVVYAETATLGWSRAKTDDNIFGHLGRDCVCIGDDKPDPQSIMIYPIPSKWTFGTFSTPLNTRISARDHRCLEREYGA